VGRILGFDYGRARIGVATSDERHIIASPFCVVSAGKNLTLTINAVKDKIKALGNIELLVVGLPLLLNGKEGDMAKEAKAFAEALSTSTGVAFVMWDERLTSAMAERLMKDDARSRKERAKSVDTLSATIILQNYLDTKHLNKRAGPV
jgi:putative Holliday junction resolvase